MKVQVGAIPVHLPEGGHEVEYTIADPGVVRAVAWTLKQRLIMARGEPQFEEQLTLFIEFSPGAPQRRRRFVVIATGQDLGVPDNHRLLFVGSAVSNQTGQVAHVYEVRAIADTKPKVAAS